MNCCLAATDEALDRQEDISAAITAPRICLESRVHPDTDDVVLGAVNAINGTINDL